MASGSPTASATASTGSGSARPSPRPRSASADGFRNGFDRLGLGDRLFDHLRLADGFRNGFHRLGHRLRDDGLVHRFVGGRRGEPRVDRIGGIELRPCVAGSLLLVGRRDPADPRPGVAKIRILVEVDRDVGLREVQRWQDDRRVHARRRRLERFPVGAHDRQRPSTAFQQSPQVYWRQFRQKLNVRWNASSACVVERCSCSERATANASSSDEPGSETKCRNPRPSVPIFPSPRRFDCTGSNV